MNKFALVVVMLFGAGAWADVILLQDGSRLEGDLKRTPDGWSITTPDGATHAIAADAVKSVELGASGASRSAVQSAAGLASLRRSVEALSDLDQIISRYERLIESTPDKVTRSKAVADLDQWRLRKKQGLIKHGSQWVAPEQIAVLAAAATAQAHEARELIRQSRNREAEQLLQQALSTDPQNLAALYLRGVTLYRQDKLPDARRAFEAVSTIAPEHPPTLNNLAVILWRQNQQAGALNYYDQAMQAAGVNDYILNNVAEALGTLPEPLRKGVPATRSMRRFAELDLVLQQRRAQEGFYRWGSSWVDQKMLDELRAAEKEVGEELASMQAEFEQTQVRITQIDSQVAANERSMGEMSMRVVFRDAQGRLIAMPLPSVYYDLQRENEQLRAEQQSLQLRLGWLQEQAQRVRQQLPVPQFTGVQQIVGVEGMPGPADMPPGAAPPATMPQS